MTSNLNVNPDEISKFSSLAERWWDLEGEFKTLHQINPLRLRFVHSFTSLHDRKTIDVGCGGGILSEGMARMGADVTGIDMSEELIDIADLHGLESEISVNYQKISAEEMAAQSPAVYDIVTCMEMLEHVPDPASIVKACATLVKPGGWVFISTLNRKPKAYLLAILAAEYVLKMLPKGTHDYKTFITPAELSRFARHAGLELVDMVGISYNPFTKEFSLGQDIDVNYIAAFKHTG